MQKILTRKLILENSSFFIEEIIKGKVFIYPTDTLQGLGTNGLDTVGITRIMDIKKRTKKAFLVIAPTLEWIFENCFIANDGIEKTLKEKLPGPYSFILELKNRQAVNPLAINHGSTIGVRLPNNWFAKIIEQSGVPFLSTSINFSGEASAKSLAEVPKEIIDKVDYVVWDEVASSGRGSVIIDVTTGVSKIIRN